MANKYFCSSGERVSEATVQKRLSEAYRGFYLFEPIGSCEGCGEPATCTAHIVPKAICKQLGKTEMIWNPFNWFRSCYRCNAIAENVSSDEIKTLLNYNQILEVTKVLDPQRYQKLNDNNL